MHLRPRTSLLVASATLLALASCASPAGHRAALVASFDGVEAPRPFAVPQEPAATAPSLASESAADRIIDQESMPEEYAERETVEGSPWIPVAGKHTIGGSSGWAIFEGDVELTDIDGGLGFESGQDDSALDPVWGFALKYNYFFNENFALGAIFELRTFDASLVQPLSAQISPDEYTSAHFLLSSRLYTNPLEFAPRAKLFGGIDLGYIPGIELEADVIYSPSFRETIELNGDEFFTIGFVAGTSLWVGDIIGMDASVEFGAFYETTFDETEDTVTLNLPNGLGGTTPNRVDGSVVPQGVIFFAGATLYL